MKIELNLNESDKEELSEAQNNDDFWEPDATQIVSPSEGSLSGKLDLALDSAPGVSPPSISLDLGSDDPDLSDADERTAIADPEEVSKAASVVSEQQKSNQSNELTNHLKDNNSDGSIDSLVLNSGKKSSSRGPVSLPLAELLDNNKDLSTLPQELPKSSGDGAQSSDEEGKLQQNGMNDPQLGELSPFIGAGVANDHSSKGKMGSLNMASSIQKGLMILFSALVLVALSVGGLVYQDPLYFQQFRTLFVEWGFLDPKISLVPKNVKLSRHPAIRSADSGKIVEVIQVFDENSSMHKLGKQSGKQREAMADDASINNPYLNLPNNLKPLDGDRREWSPHEEDFWSAGLDHHFPYQHFYTIMEMRTSKLSGSQKLITEKALKDPKVWIRLRAAALAGDLGVELSLNQVDRALGSASMSRLKNYFKRYRPKASPGELYLMRQVLKLSNHSKVRSVILQALSRHKNPLRDLYLAASGFDSENTIRTRFGQRRYVSYERWIDLREKVQDFAANENLTEEFEEEIEVEKLDLDPEDIVIKGIKIFDWVFDRQQENEDKEVEEIIIEVPDESNPRPSNQNFGRTPSYSGNPLFR